MTSGRAQVIAALAVLAAIAPASARAGESPRSPEPVRAAAGEAPPHSGERSLRELVRPPSRRRGSTVARVVAPAFARARPTSPREGWRLGVQTAWSGQPQTLLVLDSAVRRGTEWVKLLLPVRPNGTAGWVPRDRVALGRTRYWIDIDTGARQVSISRGGKRVRRFRAVVGAPGTPTPLGLAAIYERNPQPDPGGFLGPWAMPLTIMSNVHMSFGGGPGRIGIHGRAGASLADPLGSARSNGCVRIDNHHATWIAAKLPAGTPVMIKG
jgi:lipoprotein-anchoring transpeptidase ErfK/SrfK